MKINSSFGNHILRAHPSSFLQTLSLESEFSSPEDMHGVAAFDAIVLLPPPLFHLSFGLIRPAPDQLKKPRHGQFFVQVLGALFL
jgi:hypothetical protein